MEDAGHFVGTVRLGDTFRGSVLDRVHVTLAPASTVTLASGSGRQALQFEQYIIGADLSVDVPAFHGDTYLCDDLQWSMDVPEQDLAVIRVAARGIDLPIGSDRLIEAGSRRFAVEVQSAQQGLLVIDHDRPPDDAIAPSIYWTHTLPDRRPVKALMVGIGSFALDADSPPKAVDAPPKGASRIEPSAVEGGYGIPLVDYPRKLWVGRPGYAWAQLFWDSDSKQETVRLTSAGTLRIDLAAPVGAYRTLAVEVLQGERRVLHWAHLGARETLRSLSVPSGAYALRVYEARLGGRAPVWEQRLEVEPDRENRVRVELPATARDVGSLIVRVALPPVEPDLGLPLRVVLAALEHKGDSRRHITQIPLADARATDGVAEVVFDGIVTGVYEVGLAPLGLYRDVVVEAAETETVEFDCSDLARVHVNLLDEDGEILDPREATVTVKWFVGGPQAASRGRSISAVTALAMARTVEQSLSLTCTPGRLTLVPFSREGLPVGPVTSFEVYSGPNDLYLELTVERVCAQIVEFPHLTREHVGALELAALERGAFRDQQGTPASAAFCRVRPVSGHPGSEGLEVLLVFADASVPIAAWSGVVGRDVAAEFRGEFEPSPTCPIAVMGSIDHIDWLETDEDSK